MYTPIKIQILKTLLILTGVLLWSCEAEIPSKKINGISLVAASDPLKASQIISIVKMNANHVAITPYAFLSSKKGSELIFDNENQWYGETSPGIAHAILLLKRENLRLMIKPHIWIRNGEFPGDLSFNNESGWKKFETSYRKYILLYAHLAEEHNVELFCLGTELFNFVKARPEFWKKLIMEVREVYSGKLVYAENWDKAEQVELWEYLDFIGVDAYFPLSGKKNPDEQEIKRGWQKHKLMLEALSSEFNKPILFTEYGYRSSDNALKEPWNSQRDMTGTNQGLQARALKVLYKELWNENWFAGGFLWKWHQYEDSGGAGDNMFTPQNKTAEDVIQRHYRNFRN